MKENRKFSINTKQAFFIGGFVGVFALPTIGFVVFAAVAMVNGGVMPVALAMQKIFSEPSTAAFTAGVAPVEATALVPADHILGTRDAKVTLVEYGDYECPYCKQFHPTIQQVASEYQDKVRWVYRHFPLPFHQNAPKEAEAAECVAELQGNDAFWKFTSAIFERTESGGTGFPLRDLPILATEVGVNENKFSLCLNSGKYAPYVAASMQSGVKGGVTGTPSVVIFNDSGQVQLIPGAVSYEELKRTVEALLN